MDCKVHFTEDLILIWPLGSSYWKWTQIRTDICVVCSSLKLIWRDRVVKPLDGCQNKRTAPLTGLIVTCFCLDERTACWTRKALALSCFICCKVCCFCIYSPWAAGCDKYIWWLPSNRTTKWPSWQIVLFSFLSLNGEWGQLVQDSLWHRSWTETWNTMYSFFLLPRVWNLEEIQGEFIARRNAGNCYHLWLKWKGWSEDRSWLFISSWKMLEVGGN